MGASDPAPRPNAPTRLLLTVAGVLVALGAIVTAGVVLLTAPVRAPRINSGMPAAQLERCIDCHATPAEDPGGAHAAAVIGCEPCHLGDPRATTADAAHLGMEPEPGALRTASRTCGRCHARELERVRTSLMATARGIVAVDRWAFGERATRDGDETMADVLAAAHPTPAQDHLRRLCAGCHLGTTRDNRDDAIVAGGSGCGACHSPARPPLPEGATLLSHPTVDGRVDDGRCLGCHSRSGRISLGYQGLFETSGAGIDACPEGDRVTLHDGRTGCRAPADVHQRAGMACIDCHLHTELMGDGTAWAHEEQATEVRCESCHGPAASPEGADDSPATATWGAVADAITLDLLRQRGEVRAADEPVRAGRRGTPLWNVRPQPGHDGWVLVGKLDGRARPIRATPHDLDHERPGHERLVCAACHDTWAPRCPTCHTSFEEGGTQWDFGTGSEMPGRWHERNEGMSWAPPTLGVNAAGRVVPTMPGMIATLADPGPPRSLRLYAAIVPHTTQREARSCLSCHADSIALGLGEGRLELDGDAVRFSPRHVDPDAPDQARDRWVSLFPEHPGDTTRAGGRSLDAAEQRRVLTVGACLVCHAPDDALFASTLGPALERLARRRAPSCRGRVAPWMGLPSSP